MKRIFYAVFAAAGMLAGLFSIMPAAAQGDEGYGFYKLLGSASVVGVPDGLAISTQEWTVIGNDWYGGSGALVYPTDTSESPTGYTVEWEFTTRSSSLSDDVSIVVNVGGGTEAIVIVENALPSTTYSGSLQLDEDEALRGFAGYYGLHLTEFSFISYNPDEEPAIENMPFDPYCYIVITDTVTLTDTMGITSTEVITTDYTAESNLLRNYSFEDGISSPDVWQPTSNESPIPPYYSMNDPDDSRTGADHAYAGGQVELWNYLSATFPPGNYLAGFHAKSVADFTNPAVIARFNSSSVAAAAVFTNTYQVYSNTIEVGGGSTWFVLSFLGAGDIQVDDAFVYPLDENGDLFCDPLYYPPPEEEEDEEPPIAGVIPNESVACWDCQTPDNWFSIGLWVRWLGCKIHNLFYCALYVWLLAIGNWISGVLIKLTALLVWLPNAFQRFLDWGVNVFNNALAWLGNLWNVVRTQLAAVYRSMVLSILNSSLMQTIWGWFSWIGAVWDVVKLLLDSLIEIIHRVYLALIDMIEFLVETFYLLRDALSADLWRIRVVTQDGQEVDTLTPGDLYADGPNPTKILWLFLSGIGSVDYIVGMFSEFEIMLVVVVGIMAIGVFMWTARIWHDILPI